MNTITNYNICFYCGEVFDTDDTRVEWACDECYVVEEDDPWYDDEE